MYSMERAIPLLTLLCMRKVLMFPAWYLAQHCCCGANNVCRLATPPRLLQLPYTAGLPSFLLLGGLVLTPVTVPYLELSYGRDWPHKAPASLRDLLSQWPKEQGEQVSALAVCGTGDATAAVTVHRLLVAVGVPSRASGPAPCQLLLDKLLGRSSLHV
jgi:hypothetical protein